MSQETFSGLYEEKNFLMRRYLKNNNRFNRGQ